MIISELIKELEHQKELHGDIDVEIYASTDCGYSGGGGKIEEITLGKGYTWYSDHHDEYDAIILNNYEG